MAKRSDPTEGCGCALFLVAIIVGTPILLVWEYPWLLIPTVAILGVYFWYQSDKKRREVEEAVSREKLKQWKSEQLALKQEKELKARVAAVAKYNPHKVFWMEGLEFERFMAGFLKAQGYKVTLTRASGDQGADLVLESDGRKIVVQLKRYSRPLGNRPVQEALAAMFHYKADEAWVIATTSFTTGAVEIAKSTGVRLIDGWELQDWLEEAADELPKD